MEVIKKTIKRAMKIGEVVPCTFRDPNSGDLITECVHEECRCYEIVPDLNTYYNFKILLTSKVNDIGFFDAAYGYGYCADDNPENHEGINE